MILSLSRRTDLPAYYLPWFLNRLRAGWALVRNPYNPNQISRINLSGDNLECLIFWSKNPAPLLNALPELEPYPYYVQFTLNAYGRDLERQLPGLEQRLATFKRLSAALGPERVVWRYSPVAINQTYTPTFHQHTFDRLCAKLAPFTRHCHLSFLDMYTKIAARMRKLGVREQTAADKQALTAQLAAIAHKAGIELSLCGGPDLSSIGIPASSCVDQTLISRLTGAALNLRRDSGQRTSCNCSESIDLGAYQTCVNGCAYCYANYSELTALRKAAAYDPNSPLLCDTLRPGDQIKDRPVRLHQQQASQFRF